MPSGDTSGVPVLYPSKEGRWNEALSLTGLDDYAALISKEVALQREKRVEESALLQVTCASPFKGGQSASSIMATLPW